MSHSFDKFFATATTPPGEAPRLPYAYQRRLAGALEGPAPSGPFPCRSQRISIPTGLGKTAAVVRAWPGALLHPADIQASANPGR